MAEPLWTFAEAAQAMSASADASVIGGVSIDSRTIAPGDLFFAIKGDRHDGHDFVPNALERGATAAVVAHDYQGAGALLRVDDPLEALNRLGCAARARLDAGSARVIGITGSVGKTGTKEMLRLMLADQGAAHASEKSYNNLWGVPLSLARMPRTTRFGIFEMGMNHADEITPLTKMVRPHIAIITTVAPVHIEFFDSEAGIADAKAEIFSGLEPGGVAILPVDNKHFDRLAAHARQCGAEVIAFGTREGAAARLLQVEPTESGSEVKADILGQTLLFSLNAPGAHLASNAVAALAAVKLAGGDIERAAMALAHFENPEGRGRRTLFETPGGPILLIDESYNANPASTRAALNVLASIRAPGIRRRIAVLGDMLELGHGSAQYHTELADAIDFAAIDLVFCAGPQMARLFERLPEGNRGGYAATSGGLPELLLPALRPGDAVMVKGSLGSRMGAIVEALRLHFGQPRPDGGAGRSDV